MPLFILSLIYSGHFLILLFGYFLKIAVLISQKSNSTVQAYNYYVINNIIIALASILIIIYTKSLKNLYLKSKIFNTIFLKSIIKYAYNKKLVINLIYTQLLFIIYVLIASPDLSILSFNRVSTISLTIKGIRYIYPFLIALSPSLFASSLLSILTLKNIKLKLFHYILCFLSLINVFLIGQRGLLFSTLLISLLTSLLFSIYRLINAKLNFSKLRYWFLLLFFVPLVYNLRNLNNLGNNALFNLKTADLLPIKAWEGAINITETLNIDIAPIFNNIFNFLNHQSRIDLGVLNSSDIVNSFLFPNVYYDKGFGLNITIPMDLYISLGGKWLWMPLLLIYYTFILYRYIKSTQYFLFIKNSLLSYFLITAAFSLIFSTLGMWPLALIFYLESHLIVAINREKTIT